MLVFLLIRLLEVNAHNESCRAVRFVNEGRGSLILAILFQKCICLSWDEFGQHRDVFVFFPAIVTGSPDCSILASDTETGSAITRLENSHGWVVS